MKNKIVVKDNALINASYNLDVTEQRLILLAIAEARESQTGITTDNELIVHASSYINTFEVERHTAYESLKEACLSLFGRQFSYQFDNEHGNLEKAHSRWVSKISYVENEAIVKLIFAPDIIPLITRLEECFTSYDLKQIAKLTSRYAIRLYELLISWRSVGKTRIYGIQEFRSLLGIEGNEYARTEAFKRRVLEVAISQITEFTDINVKYEQHKKGKSITGFSFSFKQKKEKSPPKLTGKQVQYFSNLLAHDPSFASRNSKVGESYPDFQKRIADELLLPQNIQLHLEDLKRLGLKI